MMIEMKERMTCLNSILADREAPFTLEYCQRWKNNCMLEAYQLVNPKKNCSPTIFMEHGMKMMTSLLQNFS